MKLITTSIFYYLIYFAIALFTNPSKGHNSLRPDTYKTHIDTKEVSIAQERTDLLHSELLFRF